MATTLDSEPSTVSQPPIIWPQLYGLLQWLVTSGALDLTKLDEITSIEVLAGKISLNLARYSQDDNTAKGEGKSVVSSAPKTEASIPPSPPEDANIDQTSSKFSCPCCNAQLEAKLIGNCQTTVTISETKSHL